MQKQIEAPYFQGDFPPEEFAARRRKLLDRIGGEACALLQGAGPARGFETFRQHNDFTYLCGVEVPQAFLWIDGRRRTTTLLLPERGEPDDLAPDDEALAVRLTGVDAVRPAARLAGLLREAGAVYLPHAPAEGRNVSRDVALRTGKRIAADPWDAAPERERRFIDAVRREAPSVAVRDLNPLLDALRLVKSPREIALLRKAGRLSALGVVEAMRSTRPGVRAYGLEALADYHFRVNGARGAGYAAILPSGDHVWHAHWFRNDDVLREGELVLMDYAPDVGHYTSDIGRMWPVNGRYSPEQRELCAFMVRWHRELLRRLKPGVLAAAVLEEAGAEMKRVIDATSWSRPSFKEAALETLQYSGHLSHPVGMAVHDVGDYKDRPLEPGVCFAVDPQLWVRGERLYVRVEDTVIVTEEGIENVTRHAPLALEEIEALVGTGGLLQAFPPEGGDGR